ncbi:MAG: ribosome maturation factor RimP [Gemmatimonadaceae bacterium]
MKDELERVVADELGSLGLDLYELRRGGSKTRPLLDVRIDREGGEKVTVDDCARASRAVEARLEGSGLVPERYVLEVSSPGMERRLRHAADWRRYVGRDAMVLSDSLGGRVEGTIEAVNGTAGQEVAVLRTKTGDERRVPLEAVKEARLAFNWKR